MQFFGHEEGRVRKITLANGTLGWAYDYMLKDHLGNVRAVLTEEKKQDVYPAATLEDGAVGTEAAYYDIKSGNIQTMTSIAAFFPAMSSTQIIKPKNFLAPSLCLA